MDIILKYFSKIRSWLAGRTDMVQKTAITALALLLVITICIFSRSVSHIQSEYALARNELGESVYLNLYGVYTSYGASTQTGADMQNSILPAMSEYYEAAVILDDALTRCYGSDYQVLTATVRSGLSNAFEAFESAYRTGKSTAAAEDSMAACMNSLESILLTRFDSDGRLLPIQ